MSLPTTYTAAQVAEALHCSEWFIRDQVRRNVVRPLRLGSHLRAPMRFTEEDIAALQRAMRPAAPAPKRRRIA